ncbi:MAG: CHRD domain-containing protein [Balneolaceae bacterium]|nr:MAG: CHRD domain-containing protein [Balneolaceae bacterium]
MKKITIAFTLSFIISMAGFGQATYNVALTGIEHVPPVGTPAFGNLEVWFDSDTLYVRGTFTDLVGQYWAGHIHFGEPGKTGNRLFRLKADLNENQREGSFHESENKFALRPAQRQALRNGNLYIVISSHRHQMGEIRGQIPRM